MLLITIGAYAIIAAVQMPRLIKNKYWRDLFFFCAFLGMAVTLSLFYLASEGFFNMSIALRGILDAIGLHY